MTTRIFSPDQLKALVNETLPAVPDGHTNAIVGGIDQTGAQVVASFKLGPGNYWTVTGVARHEWSGDNQVGANVIYSW